MKPGTNQVCVHPKNDGERIHGGILITDHAMLMIRGGTGGGGPIDPQTPPPQNEN